MSKDIFRPIAAVFTLGVSELFQGNDEGPQNVSVPAAPNLEASKAKEQAAAQAEADIARKKRAARKIAGDQNFTSTLGAAGFSTIANKPKLLGGTPAGLA